MFGLSKVAKPTLQCSSLADNARNLQPVALIIERTNYPDYWRIGELVNDGARLSVSTTNDLAGQARRFWNDRCRNQKSQINRQH